MSEEVWKDPLCKCERGSLMYRCLWRLAEKLYELKNDFGNISKDFPIKSEVLISHKSIWVTAYVYIRYRHYIFLKEPFLCRAAHLPSELKFRQKW